MRIAGLIAVLALGLLVAGNVPAKGSRPAGKSAAPAEAEKNAGQDIRPNAVVVYYFHGDFRCQKCLAMQAYSEEALRGAFKKELDEGKLVFRLVNVDREKNRHFMEDYKLFTRSLVLSGLKDGREARWKNLKRIWELVGDKPAFIKYVEEETSAYLKAGK